MDSRIKKHWTKPLVSLLSIKAGTTKAISNGKSESFDVKFPGNNPGPSAS